MQINPYLFFDGQCEAAVHFYAKCFGGVILGSMKYGAAPGAKDLAPDVQDRIMHAALKVGNTVLMASDCPPGRYEKPQGINVSIDFDEPEDAERVFKELSQNADVRMPMAETFWASRFGMLIDQFGTPWMIGCNKKDQPA